MCPNENESVSSISKIPAKSKEINWKLLGIALGIVFSAYGAFFGTHSYFLSQNIIAKEENLKTESRILAEMVELSEFRFNLRIDSLIAQKNELQKQIRSFAEREKDYINRVEKLAGAISAREVKTLVDDANKSRSATLKQDSILSKTNYEGIKFNRMNNLIRELFLQKQTRP